ncbi:MAG: SDR family NAD(P)-dependent oxidoreductase [Clostridia bacterium]|nr:SDR family NAD(P)-dependent oxidoreductase [Clostridia bacterium]
MRNWLENEYVILTGASGGIGKELCKLLICKYKANVIGIGRNEQKMRLLMEELGENVSRFSCRLFDVSDKSAWQDFVQELLQKGIKPMLLINNAGAFPTFNKALNTPAETLERIMRVNYFSIVYAVETVAPILAPSVACKRSGKPVDLPAVVNIASSAALCSVVGTAAYSASKSAVKGYTEVLQMEEKGKKYIGIIYPGTTATELFRDDEHTKNSALDKIAMPADKMAKKIAKKILKKRKRAVVGWDAKLMYWTAKIMPVKGPALIAGVMKISKSKVFTDVFDERNG